MKKSILLLALLAWIGSAMAQITVHTTYEVHTTVVHQTVLDTMAAYVSTDRMALDVSPEAHTVTSRAYDFLTNTVVEERRTLDDNGYCVSIQRKIGHLNSGNYASLSGDMMVGGSVEYTNVITLSNTYKDGKISKVSVEDMELGEYEINYKYDPVGNLIGHDTVFDGGDHHTDYIARYNRYHHPYYVKDTRTGIEYEYSYTYNNSVQMGQIASMTVTATNPSSRTATSTTTTYTYDAQNRLVTERVTSDIEGLTTIDYTYDANGLVIQKDTKGETTKFEEIVERDSYGSCVLKKIVQSGKVILQIYNDIDYSTGSEV